MSASERQAVYLLRFHGGPRDGATVAIDLHYRGQMNRDEFERLARRFPD